MKKIFYTIAYLYIISTVLLLSNVPVCARSINIPDDIPYVLIDSNTGHVIAEQNAEKQIRPASLTKILTAIVALENGDLQQQMDVSQEAVYDIGKGGMNIGIMAGETGFTLENMLNVMLIKSANETANIIAENLAPSRSEYIDIMNEKANELGAVDTYYVNPSGKDTDKEDADHFTTAHDMAVMARYAMTIPEFRKIVSTEYYEGLPATNKHDGWDPLRNTNKLLWYDNTRPYTFNGEEYKYTVIGVKTGYTGAAGNNLVIAATGVDGMELICVVMHVMQSNKVYGYATELLQYGFENYSMQKISEAGQAVKTVVVDDAPGSDNILELVTETGFSAALPAKSGVDGIDTRIEIGSDINAPITKGDVLGYIEYISDGKVLGTVNLTASKTIHKIIDSSGFDTNVAEENNGSRYSYIVLTVLLILSGFVILRTVLKKISKRIKKKRYKERYYRSR